MNDPQELRMLLYITVCWKISLSTRDTVKIYLFQAQCTTNKHYIRRDIRACQQKYQNCSVLFIFLIVKVEDVPPFEVTD